MYTNSSELTTGGRSFSSAWVSSNPSWKPTRSSQWCVSTTPPLSRKPHKTTTRPRSRVQRALRGRRNRRARSRTQRHLSLKSGGSPPRLQRDRPPRLQRDRPPTLQHGGPPRRQPDTPRWNQQSIFGGTSTSCCRGLPQLGRRRRRPSRRCRFIQRPKASASHPS